VVVHNGARLPASSHELDRAETRKALGLGNSEPVAIWVGSLHSHKDPLVAVRAAEQASVTLLLVGDGPLRPEVERTARRWARVLGRREDVPRLLAAADFFVLTSHHEGFSFSLLESMAHRLPAVVTDLPENVEAVGDAGFAVRCADEHALTGAVRRLAENVREREELGRRAQSRVSQLLSAERMIAGTRAIYDRVLARLVECYTPSPVPTLSTRFRALTPRYRRAQREAQELYREWNARGTSEELLHPMWHAAAGVFGEMVSQGVPADFLTHPLVRHMFYRTGFGELEQIQAAYIDLTKPWIREMCARYREPSVGQPVHDWPSTGSSVSTLNKLYYFCRIVESAPPSDLRTVLEFGGGYGLMCHMLEELLEPRPTYIMIDLPELLALQYVFLRAGTAIPVTPHTYPPIRLREKTVNLVPVQLVADADLNCDLFLSTFALSETPLKLQEFVAQERRFFGARHVYLVGQNTQDDLWREYALEEMNSVRDTVQRLYDSIRLEPFPVVSAWELIASQPRPAARL
jgi:Glycosyl transferases group 1